jgi:hypothetical protein
MFKALFKLIKKSIKVFAIFIAAMLALGFAINTYHNLTDTPEEAQAREATRLLEEEKSAEARAEAERIAEFTLVHMSPRYMEVTRKLYDAACYDIEHNNRSIMKQIRDNFNGIVEDNWADIRSYESQGNTAAVEALKAQNKQLFATSNAQQKPYRDQTQACWDKAIKDAGYTVVSAK